MTVYRPGAEKKRKEKKEEYLVPVPPETLKKGS